MNLILAEKPSVARKIAYALKANNKKNGYYEGNGYIITYAYGHLYELYDIKDYENGFDNWEVDKFPYIPKQFKYKIKNDSEIKKQLKTIKELANRKDIESIIAGTDADREGQLIFSIIYKELGLDKPIKRLWISSYTPEEIYKGMKNLKDYKEVIPLEKAAYCRQQMDWLFGINYTSLITLLHGQGKLLNIGRVILPTVKLIHDRDLEIQNFKKEKYYQLKAIFEAKNQQYEGIYIDSDNNDKFKMKAELEDINNAIQDKPGIIVKKEEKTISENAPLLFNLTDLQGYMTSKYESFDSDKVLKTAQLLYEKGYISYPRTASRYLDTTQKDEVKKVLDILSKDYPSEYNIRFKDNHKIFDSKKVDSHPALIPTYIKPEIEKLSNEERLVYEEIKKRFLAQFMPPNEYLDITIITEIDSYRFLTKERNLIKDGWNKLYKDNENSNTPNMKRLKENDISKILYSNIQEKETQPPKHYTEKTLLKAMENCGKNISEEDVENILKGYTIGTPATRSEVIKKIINVGYIKKKGKSLMITDLGKELIEVFPIKELMDTDFTGRIEKSLKDIEMGKVSADIFMDKMIKYTIRCSEIIKNNKETISDNVINTHKIIGKCPECGADVIAGKKAYGCSNWKNGCKFAIWYNQLEKLGMKKISEKNAKKLLNNERVKLTLTSYKTGKAIKFQCYGKLKKENNKWGIKLLFE